MNDFLKSIFREMTDFLMSILPTPFESTPIKHQTSLIYFGSFLHAPPPPPSVGGLDLDSRNSGCARLGGEVGPPLGVVVEEVAVLVVLSSSSVGIATPFAPRCAEPWMMMSRARSRRRRAQPRCAVCPQAFWMRVLYMPLVRLASSL